MASSLVVFVFHRQVRMRLDSLKKKKKRDEGHVFFFERFSTNENKKENPIFVDGGHVGMSNISRGIKKIRIIKNGGSTTIICRRNFLSYKR